MTIHNDQDGMRAALSFSAKGRGWTSPRPSVGCVLVQNGEVIGGGHTQPGDGNPHAEVFALNQARQNGLSTRGATAYVTLEPCSHWGTTPPCTNALIEAGIARVVYGVLDPNVEINGRGVQQLQDAGIEVIGEFMRRECIRAQDHFLKTIVTGLPFVSLKCAVSLDGKIATKKGDSQWITNAQSRRRAHQMRHEHDAVLVGIETLLADDAQLNVRLEGEWKQPQRIVVDSRGRIPLGAKMLNDEGNRVLVATTEAMPRDKRTELENRGARVLVLPGDDRNRVSLSHLWRVLIDEKIYSILIEGGAQIAASALKSGNVDQVAFFVAPIVIGGDGIGVLPPLGTESLAQALRLRDVQTESLDGDVLVQGYTHDIV
ncbi:MAG TPA: bifunctional diaminohydroxyphosphoribosylaminopyrimidine deaminase/5-amino-6-(5-phosphoribosylamino)uracil reductase RibD [Abditibacteriaceae bacterium]|nr:bifunctional diaminohydroxyphosphoribosylaminopyrimidine deaminase/5-amino-6-(5-phosphoribosylamino)uracil reductase RibD [Abditibacteriaceae bacterium]